jgi:hypothetical protein
MKTPTYIPVDFQNVFIQKPSPRSREELPPQFQPRPQFQHGPPQHPYFPTSHIPNIVARPSSVPPPNLPPSNQPYHQHIYLPPMMKPSKNTAETTPRTEEVNSDKFTAKITESVHVTKQTSTVQHTHRIQNAVETPRNQFFQKIKHFNTQ